VLLLLAVVLGLSAGCGGGQGSLEGRAASYYNYMAGRTPETDYSSFLSPAYRRQFKRDALRQMNQALSHGTKASTRYPEIKAANIAVSVFHDKQTRHDYGYSVVDPLLGDAYANLQPVRWVRDGLRWYVYMGSEQEMKRYGAFPGGFGPPAPPKPKLAEEQAAPAKPAAQAAPESSAATGKPVAPAKPKAPTGSATK
jgi:hypothetical protein